MSYVRFRFSKKDRKRKCGCHHYPIFILTLPLGVFLTTSLLGYELWIANHFLLTKMYARGIICKAVEGLRLFLSTCELWIKGRMIQQRMKHESSRTIVGSKTVCDKHASSYRLPFCFALIRPLLPSNAPQGLANPGKDT